MAKTKKEKFQWLWIIIPLVIVVFLAFYSLSKNNLSQSQQSSLETLQFGNTANRTITKEDAIVKVKTIPEVVDYIIRVPQAKVEVGGEENDSYLIQVFEVVKGHTATFNWYKVDKTTGEVKKEF